MYIYSWARLVVDGAGWLLHKHVAGWLCEFQEAGARLVVDGAGWLRTVIGTPPA